MIAKLGFSREGIAEAIVTTYNEDGSPNAAPMGVLSDGRQKVVLKVGRETDTRENILRGGFFVVNVASDPLLFLRTALTGWRRAGEEVEVPEVRPSDVEAPFLRDADAYLEVELRKFRNYTREDELGRRRLTLVEGEVTGVRVLKALPRALNRGTCAVIELAVELSRGRSENMQEYLATAKKCLPQAEYRNIRSFIHRHLDSSEQGYPR